MEMEVQAEADLESAWHKSAAWITSGIGSAVGNAVTAIKDEYTLTFEDHCCPVLDVLPHVKATEFPTAPRRHWLAARLNRDHGSDYLVVNLSGQDYDTTEFQGPIMDVAMSGCVPPVDILVRLCVAAHKWVSLGSGARSLIVHGGPGLGAVGALGPAVVLLAAYVAWIGNAANPKEAMLNVCTALGLRDGQVWPSQRRYLSYFELLQRGVVRTAVAAPLQLTRLVLVEVGGDGISRSLEVWQQDNLLFRESFDSPEAAGAIVNVDRTCHGDVSIRVLRGGAGERPSEVELQVCFHVAFVSGDFIRFLPGEIDSPVGSVPEGCTIDVFFEPAPAREAEDATEALREAVSSDAAAAAVADGPKDCFPSGDAGVATADLSVAGDSSNVESGARPAYPVFSGPRLDVGSKATALESGPMVFDMAGGDDDEPPEEQAEDVSTAPSSGCGTKTVFAPDDIDAFFDDL